MQVISSKENEIVKHIKKLKEKKYREEYKEYLIEGVKMLKEALQENVRIKQIIICEECLETGEIPKDLVYEIAKYDCYYVTEKLFKQLTQVVSPQGILAVIDKNIDKNDIDYTQDIMVALDDIQDPGNLGTILRTLDSIGLNQVLVSEGTTDSFNPKVVRSTMGAIFRVKIIECEDIEQTLKEVKKHKFKVVITTPKSEETIYDLKYEKKVIVIGNESKGVREEIQDLADEKITIPMLGKAESLNASVATGIILYEYVRKKLEKDK